eukprot:TRINITY_DN13024_c0_g1_i2.p1 TRINITY_DN13024_c0_g1~~TRINITY_DN13024_c0_g1_i2.p1  ORF type:complete len:163 (-),score=37.36 TRINITY_DN13024_c0_g1_i2:64-492(-)
MCIRDRYQRRVHGKWDDCKNQTIDGKCLVEFDTSSYEKGTYYLGIRGYVWDGRTSLRKDVFYNTVEVHVLHHQARMFHYYLLGTAVIIASLLIGCLYFIRRYKQVQKRLNYELQDVRNVANVGAPVQNQIYTYHVQLSIISS